VSAESGKEGVAGAGDEWAAQWAVCGAIWQGLIENYVEPLLADSVLRRVGFMSDEKEGFAEEGVGTARRGFEPKRPPIVDRVSFSFETPHNAQTAAFLKASGRWREALSNVTGVWLRGEQGGQVEVLVEMEIVPGDRRWFRAIEDTAGPGLSHCAEAEGAYQWREVLFDDGGLKYGRTYGEIQREAREQNA
jgi:hypothetical protein